MATLARMIFSEPLEDRRLLSSVVAAPQPVDAIASPADGIVISQSLSNGESAAEGSRAAIPPQTGASGTAALPLTAKTTDGDAQDDVLDPPDKTTVTFTPISALELSARARRRTPVNARLTLRGAGAISVINDNQVGQQTQQKPSSFAGQKDADGSQAAIALAVSSASTSITAPTAALIPTHASSEGQATITIAEGVLEATGQAAWLAARWSSWPADLRNAADPGSLLKLGEVDVLSNFADAIAGFAHESAALGSLAAPDGPHARAWAVTATVLAIDCVLVSYWYSARRHKSGPRPSKRIASPFILQPI